jgi:hypothetical protein
VYVRCVAILVAVCNPAFHSSATLSLDVVWFSSVCLCIVFPFDFDQCVYNLIYVYSVDIDLVFR